MCGYTPFPDNGFRLFGQYLFRCEYAGGFYQAGFLYGENVSGICLEGVGDAIDQTRSGRDGASGGCRDRSGEP